MGCVLVARQLAPAAGRAERLRLSGVLGRSPGLRTLAAAGVPLGTALGALDVAAPALAAADGCAELAAVPLAAFAAGSGGAALWIGRSPHAGSAPRRYVAGLVLLAAVLLGCLAVRSLPAMSSLLLAAGACFGAANVALFELLDDVAPEHHAAEGLAWITTAEGIGLAAGGALAGGLAARSPGAALAVLALAPVPGAALGVARRGTLTRSRPTAARRSAP